MTAVRQKISPVRYGGTYGVVFLLFVSSFVYFSVLMIKKPACGDTYLYAHSILTFEGPIFHMGYYVIGFIFRWVLSFFGFTPLETLGYMSVFFGGFSVVFMYLFTWMLTENRMQSFLSAVILMFSGSFWLFSIQGEVYVPQLAFVLLSLLFAMKKYPMFSGLSIIAAISISPTSCVALCPLVYLMRIRKYSRNEIMMFVLPVFFSLLCIVAWDFKKLVDTFSVHVQMPSVIFKETPYENLVNQILFRLAKAYGTTFNLFFCFSAFGFFVLYKAENRAAFFLMLSFFPPFLLYTFNLGLLSADHLIISSIPVSFSAARGMLRLTESRAVSTKMRYLVFGFCLLIYMCISYQYCIKSGLRDATEMNRVIHKLAEIFKGNGVFFSRFTFGTAFWYQTHEKENYYSLVGRSLNYFLKGADDRDYFHKRFWMVIEADEKPFYTGAYFKKMFGKMLDEIPVFFVDTLYWPKWGVEKILSEKALEKRNRTVPYLRKFGRYMKRTFRDEFEFIKIIESPMHPVYRLRKNR